MDTEFYTAEEVAEFLRLPLSTVYKFVQDKKIPGFKVARVGDLEKIRLPNGLSFKKENS